MKKGDIKNILNALGASTKYMGYDYIVEESALIDNLNSNNKKILLKDLDKCVAEKYKREVVTIERNIRSCIEGTFKNGNLTYINELFFSNQGYYQDRPSNKLFLTTIVNYLNKDE